MRIEYEDLGLTAPFRVLQGRDIVDARATYVVKGCVDDKTAHFLCALLDNAAAHHGVFMAGVAAERARIARLFAAEADGYRKDMVRCARNPTAVEMSRTKASIALEYAHALDPHNHPEPT